MTACGSRVERVEFPVHDAIKGHRASPRANHRGENQEKGPPTGPAPIRSRRHHHGRQGEGQGEKGVGKLYEFSPFSHGPEKRRIASSIFPPAVHSFSSPHRGASLCGTPRWSSTRATTVSATSSTVRGPE